MEISTTCFGTVTCNSSDLIHFSEGIIGFPQWKKYLPLSFQPDNDQVLCLQSVEESGLSFIVMNPFHLIPDYHPHITDEMMNQLRCENLDDLSFYVIAVIREPFEETTVNLKCPLIVNSKSRLAMQVVLEDSQYTLRHPLKSFKAEEEALC